MAEVSVTWLGDEDPGVQVISQYGISFVKGEAVKVDEKNPAMAKFANNPAFSTDKNAEPIEAIEPEKPDIEAGTEKEAVKRELDELHVKYDGRSSLDTLRATLAKEKAKG